MRSISSSRRSMRSSSSRMRSSVPWMWKSSKGGSEFEFGFLMAGQVGVEFKNVLLPGGRCLRRLLLLLLLRVEGVLLLLLVAVVVILGSIKDTT